jgi:transposase InsO family protein
MLDARGLQLPRPKPRRTTNSNHRFRKHKNLIRGFVPQAANQLWSADITYIDTETGVCYLHVITDCYSHEILGWCIADTLEAKYTLEALQMAVRNCGQSDLTGLIHHSDRGCQYCCNEYTAYLNSLGARISMTEDYKPTDNAVAERINGIIKSELLYPAKRPKNRMEASRAIEGFIHYYNSLRPHMSIGNQTPDVARQQTGPQQRLWKNYYEKTCTCRKKDVTLHPVSINRVCPDGADASTPSGQSQLPTEVDNNVRK